MKANLDWHFEAFGGRTFCGLRVVKDMRLAKTGFGSPVTCETCLARMAPATAAAHRHAAWKRANP